MAQIRKRGRSSVVTINPLAGPAMDITLKGGEIAAAAGQTIVHRTLMMWGADAGALTAKRREFTRMYTEKAQVAGECAQVIAAETLRLNQHLAERAWSNLWNAGMVLTSSLPAGRGAPAVHTLYNDLIGAASRQVSDAAQNFRGGAAGIRQSIESCARTRIRQREMPRPR